MQAQQLYNAFIESLDEDVRQILDRMDQYEGGTLDSGSELQGEVVDLLLQSYDDIDRVAAKLGGDSDQKEEHLECLLSMLSWAPNSLSFWYFSDLATKRPDVYTFLKNKLINDKPLRDYSKKLRERLQFHMRRQAASAAVFNDDVFATLCACLETLKYEK